MKRIYLLLAAFLAMPLISISCAASRSNSQSEASQFGTEVKKHECKLAAENCPNGELRVYAQAVSKNEDFAEKKAVHYAKGKIVEKIESYVEQATKSLLKDMGIDDDPFMQEEFNETVISMAKGTINDYKIVCSKTYKLENGNYKSHICISIPYGKAEKVAEATMINAVEKSGKQMNPTKAKTSREKAYKKYLNDPEDR